MWCLMVRSGNGIVSNIRVLILDDVVNEVGFCITIVKFFGWVTGTSLARQTLNMIFSCAVVLLDCFRVHPFTIIFIVNAELGLSNKT